MMSVLLCTSQQSIFAGISQHLVFVGLRVIGYDIGDLSMVVRNGLEPWVDESLIWCNAQFAISVEDFFMHDRIYFYSILFYKLTRCCIVALTLDSLYFRQ